VRSMAGRRRSAGQVSTDCDTVDTQALDHPGQSVVTEPTRIQWESVGWQTQSWTTGGILFDRPWDHDPPDSHRFGQAGPTGARLTLLGVAPLRDGASDLDTWSPPFDIAL
jgi:hypothetical protein